MEHRSEDQQTIEAAMPAVPHSLQQLKEKQLRSGLLAEISFGEKQTAGNNASLSSEKPPVEAD
jgi:hypothetical protein